ncbi:MAG: hypothetical protein MUC87_05515 [Bacteroidia bacterium]|jgi:hypothetical protein|nr:hypothetical protein [Bacteroidia bacterium]
MYADDFLSDEELLALRPAVVFDDSGALEAEKFQGHTLRPILKLKNEWLLETLRRYISQKHPGFAGVPPARQHEIIAQAVQTDKKLREQLFREIFSMMTAAEKQFAQTHRKETAKRLSSLLTVRYVSQLPKLL